MENEKKNQAPVQDEKKTFVAPTIEVVRIERTDIVAASEEPEPEPP